MQQYEPAMLKIMKIVHEGNTEISACCCQEALARMRTCLLTRYSAPRVGYGIYLVSNYPIKKSRNLLDGMIIALSTLGKDAIQMQILLLLLTNQIVVHHLLVIKNSCLMLYVQVTKQSLVV